MKYINYAGQHDKVRMKTIVLWLIYISKMALYRNISMTKDSNYNGEHDKQITY